MISGIDYGKGNDESCTVTFVSPEYINELQQENKELHNKIDKLEEYSRGNIEACENRLNTPFCNFERVAKDLMIHKNYLEILKGSDVDE